MIWIIPLILIVALIAVGRHKAKRRRSGSRRGGDGSSDPVSLDQGTDRSDSADRFGSGAGMVFGGAGGFAGGGSGRDFGGESDTGRGSEPDSGSGGDSGDAGGADSGDGGSDGGGGDSD